MLGQPSRQSIDLYHINLFGSLIFFYGDNMALSGCKILHDDVGGFACASL